MTFAVTLLPPPLYVAYVGAALGRVPTYPGLVVPFVLALCVGRASYVLNGLRGTGLRRRIMDRRATEDVDASKDAVRDKIAATLTTLTMLGSVAFAMVIFALPLLFLSNGQIENIALGRPALVDEADLLAMARPTFVFVLMLLVVTSILFLVAIDAYDTARDPVLRPGEIRGLRVFSRGSYYIGLLNLAYTVLFVSVVVQPMLSVVAAMCLVVAVTLYDRSVPRA